MCHYVKTLQVPAGIFTKSKRQNDWLDWSCLFFLCQQTILKAARGISDNTISRSISTICLWKLKGSAKSGVRAYLTLVFIYRRKMPCFADHLQSKKFGRQAIQASKRRTSKNEVCHHACVWGYLHSNSWKTHKNKHVSNTKTYSAGHATGKA